MYINHPARREVFHYNIHPYNPFNSFSMDLHQTTFHPLATLITYSLIGVKPSPVWILPSYEQVLCSCEGGTRSIAVGSSSRYDHLQPGNMVIQHGPSVTIILVDCGSEFCAYSFTRLGAVRAPLTTSAGSVFMMPFIGWSGVGMDRCIQSNSGGVVIITWGLNNTVHISITIYRLDSPTTPTSLAVPTRDMNGHISDMEDLLTHTPPSRVEEAETYDFLEAILKESDLQISPFGDIAENHTTNLDLNNHHLITPIIPYTCEAE